MQICLNLELLFAPSNDKETDELLKNLRPSDRMAVMYYVACACSLAGKAMKPKQKRYTDKAISLLKEMSNQR